MTALTNSEYTTAVAVEWGIDRHVDARAGFRHDAKATGWYAADPENCAGCALAIEQARLYCLDEDHVCDPFCWDDVRCPNCRGMAP